MSLLDLLTIYFIAIIGLLYLGLVCFGPALIEIVDRLGAVEKALGVRPDERDNSSPDQQQANPNSEANNQKLA
ncbi:MAG: hypothetical protein F4X72_08130 [Dehalococcoidia bacterium]|nr:hypothetical protein [Dehalococcoidia bacterium]